MVKFQNNGIIGSFPASEKGKHFLLAEIS